ncbi:RdgB/HAM1 family non-canonical purine NTP pyrophosphatase [Pararhizobium sp. IMCC21322]|uniref:RdgB/HAM1 family non-canonical purine NTP pyrophosphatase n=1 Tax=Pararhizobium sp. IMCC21322 TaxID=3067903 RepID=UPI0027429AE1|nr:RdgB/HAM1 family non-canonical purine NTP pyrophosphatase [Pararhizobium sp. IMCC21322]
MSNLVRRLTGGKLVLASHNAGKLREIRDLVVPHGIEVVSAAELDLPEPEETGTTFAANAKLKALASATATGFPALSDDSGLSVDCLDGDPGIYSARWAGPDKDFSMAMRNVQEAMLAKGATEAAKRGGQFVSALCLAYPDGEAFVFEGIIRGEIVWPPRGTQGFGYDPIFLPENHDKTFGEMTPQEKHGPRPDGEPGLSHRARAFALFEKYAL